MVLQGLANSGSQCKFSLPGVKCQCEGQVPDFSVFISLRRDVHRCSEVQMPDSSIIIDVLRSQGPDSLIIIDVLSSQGFSIQGFSIQSFSIQGFSIQGFSIPGFSIQGFSIQGFSIQGFSIDGCRSGC